jgi:hypothetical protein
VTERTVDRILGAIRRYRFNFPEEFYLQEGLAEALMRDGLPFDRERRVFGGRIDLLVDHSQKVGLEVKTAGSSSDVARQLRRYADGGDLDELVLVTSRRRHRHDLAGLELAIPLHVEVVGSL